MNQDTATPSVQVSEGLATIIADGIYTADELARTSGLDLDAFRIVGHKAKTWGAQQAGGRTIELGSTEVRLERLPEHISAPVKLPKWKRKKPRWNKSTPVDTVLLIPDSQNGYRRREDGALEPIHDRQAWDLAVKAASTLKPDHIVLLGDMLDLAPWSTRWPTPQELYNTTNPALAELHWWLRQLRHVAPTARITYLEGNHEHRIWRAMVDRMPEAANLRAYSSAYPALSLQHLLGLQRLTIDYVGPYGADMWLWEDSSHPVRCTHGDTHGSGGGATVAKVLKDADYSRVFGHVHRREVASKTIQGPQGPRERFALTPGCLCRVDGAVPAATARVDWQQGLGVLRRVGDVVLPELIPIVEGRMVLNGRVIEAGDPLPSIAKMFPEYRWAA